ncbi:ferric reductase-like transmembrane domain-containing protein [Priestia megaterium]
MLVHQSSGWFGLLFGMIHGLVLSFDQSIHFSLSDILIPFTSDYKPISTGLGTISLYILFVLIITSDFIKQLGRKTWKAIHFLAFPGYLLALYHGITSGTDTQQPLILGMYSITGCIVLILLFYDFNTSQLLRTQKSSGKLKTHSIIEYVFLIHVLLGMMGTVSYRRQQRV